MLTHGADLFTLNPHDYNNSLLHYTVQSQNHEMIQYLCLKYPLNLVMLYLNRGLDINTQNKFGETILHQSCTSQTTTKSEFIQKLLIFGANKKIKNNLGETPESKKLK
jgi:ankyrin repeat protein